MFDKSKWITFNTELDCITFKKEFVFEKRIKSIDVFITAIGWHHLFIDSKRTDKDILSPGWTQFNKRVQYQKYHKNINENSFMFECELARGWGGSNRFGWINKLINESIYFQKSLIYQIDIYFDDGEKKSIYSGESIDVYSNQILNASVYDGEEQNALLDYKFLGKSILIDINTKLIPQEGEKIVEGERFKAKRIFKDKKGNLIIDFGQNFAGYVEVNINGKKGDVISYTPGEIIDPDGVFYNENYRQAKSFYRFTLLNGRHIYKPRFSTMGGRYIKLIEYPKYIKKENFTGVFVHSNIKRTNTFSCGHKLLNRLYKNQYYGQLSNYLDVPTDCPQRNERLGWTADAQVFAKTACINFNVDKFLSKYVHELEVCQGKNGYIPKFVPITKDEFEEDSSNKLPTIGWSDASIIIPYEIYRAYGDKKILKESYSMMEKYFEHYYSTFDKNFNSALNIIEHGPEIINQQYGDWCALDKLPIGFSRGLTRLDLLALAYFAYDLEIMIEVEKALQIDSKKKEELLVKVKQAYQNMFIIDNHMVGEKVHLFANQEPSCYTQTGLSMTLKLKLCNEKQREILANDLVNLIKECGGKMTVGFLGTPMILDALSETGHVKEAYDLLLNEDFPSWLYSVKLGATTIWEHYDCVNEYGDLLPPEMNSFNHYAYGSFYAWVFNNVLGINAIKPGYKEVLICPHPDKRLRHANGEFITKYGKIKVSWKYNKDNQVNYFIVVPKGIKAIIKLDNGFASMLDNGGKVRL